MLEGLSLWSLLPMPLSSGQHPAREVPPLQSLREAWPALLTGRPRQGSQSSRAGMLAAQWRPSLLGWRGVTRGQEVGAYVLATLFSMSEMFHYLKCS